MVEQIGTLVAEGQFDDLLAEFERLKQQADRALGSVEDSAKEASEGLGSVDDRLSKGRQQFAAYESAVSSAADILKLTRDVGEAFADVIDTIGVSLGGTEEELRKVTDQIRALTSRGALGLLSEQFKTAFQNAGDFFGLFRDSPESFARLANELDRLGMDSLADDFRVAAGEVEGFAEATAIAEERTSALQRSVETLRERVRPSGDDILASLTALRNVYEELESSNQLTIQQLVELGKEAERLLKVFELIGKEAPADIVALAEAGQRAAESLKETAAEVEATGAATEELAESATEAGEALDKDLATGAETAKETLVDLKDVALEAGAAVNEAAKAAVESFEASRKEGAQQQQQQKKTSRSQDEATRTVEELREEVEDLTQAQATNLVVTEDQFTTLAEKTQELADAERDLSRQRQSSDEVFFAGQKTAIVGQQEINDLIQTAQSEVADLSRQYGEQGDTATASLQQIIDRFENVTDQIGVTGEDVKTFQENFQAEIERVGTHAELAFGEVEKSSKDAADATEELAESTENLADVTERAFEAGVEGARLYAEELDKVLALLTSIKECSETLEALDG